MAMEISSDRAICSMCGMAYSKWRGNFHVCNAGLYKGSGHLPYCKKCVDRIYKSYLKECGEPKDAIRQVCRKLDIYWSDKIYLFVDKKDVAQNLIQLYLKRVNAAAYAGKSYDDTLNDEGNFWNFTPPPPVDESVIAIAEKIIEDNARAAEEAERAPHVSEDVIAFWGSGYQPYMYNELEQRRKYWMASFPKDIELDASTEATIRQICSMELDINKARAAGKNVDKSVATLNTLISALNNAQGKYNDTGLADTPLGVWLFRYEHERPLPEIDDDLRDTNKILRYVFIWIGHVCKMLGKKNGFARLYEKEVQKFRVERPEFSDEDDEEMIMDIMEEEDDDVLGGYPESDTP